MISRLDVWEQLDNGCHRLYRWHLIPKKLEAAVCHAFDDWLEYQWLRR